MKKMTPTQIRNCELHEWFIENYESLKNYYPFSKAYYTRGLILDYEYSDSEEIKLLSKLKKAYLLHAEAEKKNDDAQEIYQEIYNRNEEMFNKETYLGKDNICKK